LIFPSAIYTCKSHTLLRDSWLDYDYEYKLVECLTKIPMQEAEAVEAHKHRKKITNCWQQTKTFFAAE